MEELTKKNFNKYAKYLVSYIKRDGINEFINWLITTDAAIAPASTRYHMSVEGGLIQHSLNVFYRLIKIINMEYPNQEDCPYSKETLALVALCHDVAKFNFYEVQMRNVKNSETGAWEKVPYYTTRDENNRLIFASHEENSLYILQHFFKLSYDESMAIRWHGGAFSSSDYRNSGETMNAFRHCKLAVYLHMADTMASCIDEATDVKNVNYFNEKLEDDTEESVDGESADDENVDKESTNESESSRADKETE